MWLTFFFALAKEPLKEAVLEFRISHFLIPIPEKAMAPHSSTLAWNIPWTEEPGGLQSMGFRRVGHDWATSLSLFTLMHWRRTWQPTSVFLPGESQGWRGLVGYQGSHRVGHDWSDLAAAYQFKKCRTLDIWKCFLFVLRYLVNNFISVKISWRVATIMPNYLWWNYAI